MNKYLCGQRLQSGLQQTFVITHEIYTLPVPLFDFVPYLQFNNFAVSNSVITENAAHDHFHNLNWQPWLQTKDGNLGTWIHSVILLHCCSARLVIVHDNAFVIQFVLETSSDNTNLQIKWSR